MKKLALILAVIGSICFTSCSEQEIEPFVAGQHFVYFQKFWKDAPAPGTEKADTTGVTFFFAEEADTHVYADLQVVLAGRPLAKDLNFKLKVVEDMTSALPNEYKLEDFYTFRAKPLADDAKMIDDTIRIQVNRSERLKTMKEGYYLTVEIVPTDEAMPGQFERARAVMHITEEPVQPEWWTKEISESLFGPYSAKKYKLFLVNIEGAEKVDGMMIKEHPDRVRKLLMDYKKWLAAQDKETLWDEDLQDYISLKI